MTTISSSTYWEIHRIYLLSSIQRSYIVKVELNVFAVLIILILSFGIFAPYPCDSTLPWLFSEWEFSHLHHFHCENSDVATQPSHGSSTVGIRPSPPFSLWKFLFFHHQKHIASTMSPKPPAYDWPTLVQSAHVFRT
jgi:hypothetical protein